MKIDTIKYLEKFERLKNIRLFSNLFSFTQELAMDLGTANRGSSQEMAR